MGLSTFSHAACKVKSSNGHTILLQKPAKRIISLAPSLTESLYEIGAGKQLIGVTSSSDFPNAATKLPKVADYRDLDLEKIVSLHPALILAWQGGNPQAQLDKLKQFHIPIFYSKINQLRDIPTLLKQLGCLTGHTRTANQKATYFQQHYLAIKKQHATQKRVAVFYALWQTPLLTLTKNSLVNDMIKTCGGKNIFANALGAAPEVSREAVMAAKPTVIISNGPHWKTDWQQWPEIPAVQHKKLFTINPDTLLRPTYRSLKGLIAVCHAISSKTN